MSDHDEFGAFLVGFIVGGLTGAVAALLLAPQSGEETRSAIREKSIELTDQAKAEAEKARKQAELYAADAKVKVKDISEKARQQGEELLETAKKKAREIAPKKGGDLEADPGIEI